MIKYEFNIGQWEIHLFITLDTYHIGEIIEQLWKLHCNKVQAFNAFQLMKKQAHNVGFTYSNLSNRQSVIVIGKHDTKSQLINTIAHESRHL